MSAGGGLPPGSRQRTRSACAWQGLFANRLGGQLADRDLWGASGRAPEAMRLAGKPPGPLARRGGANGAVSQPGRMLHPAHTRNSANSSPR